MKKLLFFGMFGVALATCAQVFSYTGGTCAGAPVGSTVSCEPNTTVVIQSTPGGPQQVFFTPIGGLNPTTQICGNDQGGCFTAIYTCRTGWTLPPYSPTQAMTATCGPNPTGTCPVPSVGTNVACPLNSSVILPPEMMPTAYIDGCGGDTISVRGQSTDGSYPITGNYKCPNGGIWSASGNAATCTTNP